MGKTSLAAWTADYLARQGRNVWMVDADTALSLGQASGLSREQLPEPLIARRDVISQRIGSGMLCLNPDVSGLPEELAVDCPVAGSPPGAGRKRLLRMGSVAGAGAGCACDANALLKAVLAHMVLERNDCVLVDLEAGVEHLGRGTVAHVDGVVVVSEPSLRSLDTAAEVTRLARELGVPRTALVLNRCRVEPPDRDDLPAARFVIPPLPGLEERQLTGASVLGLPESGLVDAVAQQLLAVFAKE